MDILLIYQAYNPTAAFPTKPIMSKANAEILQVLHALQKDVSELKVAIKELQEDNASAAINSDKMYKTLNAKIDVFKNMEAQSRESIQQTSTSTRNPTRPAVFKKLFLEEREKHMNVLYTQEEIDAAFQTKEVLAKKKETERISKVISILYTTHIRADKPEGRNSAFASIYDQLLNTKK